MSSFLRSSLPLVALASLGSLGCSDPIPVAVDGAYVVSFSQQSGNTKCGSTGGVSPCRVKFHTGQVGGVNTNEFNVRKRDTEGGARLACSVTHSGNGFAIQGTIEDGSDRLSVRVDAIDAMATLMKPAVGQVAYASPTTVNSYGSPPGKCNFWRSAKGEIDAGKMWIDFSCSTVDDCSHDSSCTIQQGTIAMENCDQ
jgi:hypothetical protein